VFQARPQNSLCFPKTRSAGGAEPCRPDGGEICDEMLLGLMMLMSPQHEGAVRMIGNICKTP
jgi:hypothetical protein